MASKSEAIESYLQSEEMMETALGHLEETMKKIADISQQRREMFISLMEVLERDCASLISSTGGEMSGASELESSMTPESRFNSSVTTGVTVIGPRTGGNTGNIPPGASEASHPASSYNPSVPRTAQQQNQQNSPLPATGQQWMPVWSSSCQLICPNCLVPLRVSLEKDSTPPDQQYQSPSSSPRPPSHPGPCGGPSRRSQGINDPWQTYNSIEDRSSSPGARSPSPTTPRGQQFIYSSRPEGQNFQPTPQRSHPCSSNRSPSEGSTLYQFTIPAPPQLRTLDGSSLYEDQSNNQSQSNYTSNHPNTEDSSLYSEHFNIIPPNQRGQQQQRQVSSNFTNNTTASSNAPTASDRSPVNTRRQQQNQARSAPPNSTSTPCSSRMTSPGTTNNTSYGSTLYGAGTVIRRNGYKNESCGSSSAQQTSGRSVPMSNSSRRDPSIRTSGDIYCERVHAALDRIAS